MPTEKWRKANVEKLREYRRNWYYKNQKTEQKKARIRQQKRRAKGLDVYSKNLKKWFQEYKSNLKCSKCPENDIICLDFHHRNRSDKILEVSVMVARGRSKEVILQEIEKCDVLCSNCHRKLERDLKLGR